MTILLFPELYIYLFIRPICLNSYTLVQHWFIQGMGTSLQVGNMLHVNGSWVRWVRWVRCLGAVCERDGNSYSFLGTAQGNRI